ncbi:hypothetical protein SSE37_07358 [Sagittula stellata E-37]|uniref:Uncharacterized protein n=1 Tax=Sagittula stellata (strain ATCC 700073 / DSM 11524 / E-37) TaxID=388399 RepID=A3JYQ3_SAGS3|nr:hypothetical protein SSE37_07358 [Sagittula stellata E-37]
MMAPGIGSDAKAVPADTEDVGKPCPVQTVTL